MQIDQKYVPDVRAIFNQFTPTGEMTSTQFTKFMKDTHLMNDKFTHSDVDAIFNKAREFATGGGTVPVGLKVSFQIFVDVIIPLIAQKRGDSLEEIGQFFEQMRRPALQVTKAMSVRLHDDTGTYSGISKGDRGSGNSITQADKGLLSTALLRADSLRGVMSRGNSSRVLNHTPQIDRQIGLIDDLQPIFNQYANHGDIILAQFLKMMNDLNCYNKYFNAEDVDLLFYRARTRSSNGASTPSARMNFATFCSCAIPMVADARLETVEKLTEHLKDPFALRQKGQITKAMSVRLHDDKSTYSGTMARGGGTGDFKEQSNGLESMLIDRSDYFISKPSMPELRKAFIQYAPNLEMNHEQFIKFMKETELLTDSLTLEEAEKVFMKAKIKAAGGEENLTRSTRVGFNIFYAIVARGLAEKRGQSVENLASFLSRSKGPNLTITQALPTRLHDDKKTYSGTASYGGNSPGRKLRRSDSGILNLQQDTVSDTKPGFLDIQKTFRLYAPSGEMHLNQFIRLMKEVNMYSDSFTSDDAIKIFENAKEFAAGGAENVSPNTKINCSIFYEVVCLEGISEKTGLSIDIMSTLFSKCKGPELTLTRGSSRLFDDKSTYTGTFSKSNEQDFKRSDSGLQYMLTDRSDYSSKPGYMDIQKAFLLYAPNSEMNSQQYYKLLKEANFFDEEFTTEVADALFMKGKAYTAGGMENIGPNTKVSYAAFYAHVAPSIGEKKGMTMEAIGAVMSHVRGPALTLTQAQPVRLHDDKRTYSGTFAHSDFEESVGAGRSMSRPGSKARLLGVSSQTSIGTSGRGGGTPKNTRVPSLMSNFKQSSSVNSSGSRSHSPAPAPAPPHHPAPSSARPAQHSLKVLQAMEA
mmetsp:Transcript_28268/g.28554  ORF Transcript_28268/g.28554 Transcript_28268/m.28554 type:complete len:865 (-) Transcript_28268:299-2893(-)